MNSNSSAANQNGWYSCSERAEDFTTVLRYLFKLEERFPSDLNPIQAGRCLSAARLRHRYTCKNSCMRQPPKYYVLWLSLSVNSSPNHKRGFAKKHHTEWEERSQWIRGLRAPTHLSNTCQIPMVTGVSRKMIFHIWASEIMAEVCSVGLQLTPVDLSVVWNALQSFYLDTVNPEYFVRTTFSYVGDLRPFVCRKFSYGCWPLGILWFALTFCIFVRKLPHTKYPKIKYIRNILNLQYSATAIKSIIDILMLKGYLGEPGANEKKSTSPWTTATVIHFYFGSVQFSVKRKFAVSVRRKFR